MGRDLLNELTTIQRSALAVLTGVIVVAAVIVALGRSRPLPPDSFPAPASTLPAGPRVTVYVTGAVAHPGLYVLPRGDRVAQALEAAGGATPEANLTGINLARRLKDGDRVTVRSQDRATPSPIAQPQAPTPPPAAAAAAADASPAESAPPEPGPVRLNTATAAQLAALPGLTPRLAQRIVAYRTAHGAFHRVEELLLVPGMTPAILSQIGPHLAL